MATPKEVQRAQALDFGITVTGYLCCVRFYPPVIVGVVYGDAKARFAEGTMIRTSAVIEAGESQGFSFFETLTGSIYVICHWGEDDSASTQSRVTH